VVKFFVVTYRRATHDLVRVELFDSGREALARRMAIEQTPEKTSDLEVVVLMARDREHLEQTHSRYFRRARQLFETTASRIALA
jgi:hypothetical protein